MLVQTRPFGQLPAHLELHGAGRGEGVLLLEVANGDGLHGLVGLHQQLADLLQHPRLHPQQVPVPRVGVIHAQPVVVLRLHRLAARLLLQLLPLVELVVGGGPQLGALLGDPRRVPAPLPLLRSGQAMLTA